MRATIALLCLVAATAKAQQPEASTAPPEELLTPPPMTSAPPLTAPPEEEPLPVRVPSETAHPENEFVPQPFPSSPAAEPQSPPSTAPSPPPSAAPPPPSALPPPRATSPAPSPPAWNPPPRSVGPSELPAQRAKRYSRYSAGAGGSALVITEGMTGIVTGAMLGSAFDIASDGKASDGYTGAVVGGLTLGTVATLYQYFFPVGRNEGILIAGAASAGLTAGLTVANSRGLSDKDRSLLAFTSTQLGILSVLLLTAGGGDVSSGDTGLIGSMSLYGSVIAGLIEYIHAKQSGQRYNYVPALVAPAIGMALGGLLAVPLELSPGSTFELTMYPLGTGLLALLIGSRLADEVVVAKTVLGTVAGTFFIVTLVNMLSGAPVESPERSASTFQALPVPVVMSAGRGNDSLAAGPGLFLRF